MKQLHAFVSGIVQGVCFRFFVQEKADILGLKGYVRNLADGRLEAMAEGPEEQLKSLLNFIRQGPPSSEITDIEEKWGEAENKWKGFRII